MRKINKKNNTTKQQRNIKTRENTHNKDERNYAKKKNNKKTDDNNKTEKRIQIRIGNRRRQTIRNIRIIRQTRTIRI